ncbi:hypothetical protein D3C80_2188860 [compost metagenome]
MGIAFVNQLQCRNPKVSGRIHIPSGKRSGSIRNQHVYQLIVGYPLLLQEPYHVTVHK